jgi:hypothetical protein
LAGRLLLDFVRPTHLQRHASPGDDGRAWIAGAGAAYLIAPDGGPEWAAARAVESEELSGLPDLSVQTCAVRCIDRCRDWQGIDELGMAVRA